ncbi:hypothetical protein ACHAXT_007870 [Thalassiosira profunda]
MGTHLPTGWTAYTDPVNAPPAPAPPPPSEQQVLHYYHSPVLYSPAPLSQTPPNVLSQPQYTCNSGPGHASGWNNNNHTQQHFNPATNQSNIPPPPPKLSHNYDPHWQPKRILSPQQHSYNPPAKRPCIPPPPPPANAKRCSKCGQTKNWEHFSKRQWLNNEGSRKCKPCVDIVVEDERSAAKVSASAEKARSKLCSGCGEQCAWELFSKSQWTSRDDKRKCKPCLEKMHQSDENEREATTVEYGEKDAASADDKCPDAFRSQSSGGVAVKSEPGDSADKINATGAANENDAGADTSGSPAPDTVAIKSGPEQRIDS